MVCREDGLAELERLDGLAKRINEEHRRCEGAVDAALEHAMNAGDLLIEAKGNAPHGTWQGWLADHFDGSETTAQAYMRVASRRSEVEAAKTQSSAPLSLDGALRALSAPRDAPRPERQAMLEEMEARAEDALSETRAAALGIAENLDAIRRGRGWVHAGYASFEDYVTETFASRVSFPIPYAVISDEAGESLPVFAMAENIHAWGMARTMAPLLLGSE
jgi:Protein of unknown function (DUF3102)